MDVIVLHCVLLFSGPVHGTGKASRFWARKSLNSKFPSWYLRFLLSFVDILSAPYPAFRFTGQMMFCTCAGILQKGLLWWMCQDWWTRSQNALCREVGWVPQTWKVQPHQSQCQTLILSSRHWAVLFEGKEMGKWSWNKFRLARTIILDIQIYPTLFTKWFFFLLVLHPYQLSRA